nr:hypothetical protein [Desulfovibrio sp.]
VFVKPGGDYKATVEVLVALVGGGDASSARSGLRTLPSLGGYEGDDIALTTPVGKLAAASLKARDLAPITAKDLEVESLAIETGDGEKISVAEGSFGVFSMPVTPPDPEKAALENLKIKDIQITERDGFCSAASVEAKELALNAARDAAVTKLAVSPSRGPSISVAEASVARLFIPENVENQPQKAIVEKLRIRDISAPQLGAKVEKADLDMGADSVSLLIDKASIPGAILKDFDIPTAPATIEGSLDAEGKIKNNILTAKAALNLKDLFNLGADIVGNIDDREPEKVNFVLRETGIFKYITQEQRARLAFLSLFVPGAQEALVGFLSRPGQTLSGSVTFEGRQPDFKFELN